MAETGLLGALPTTNLSATIDDAYKALFGRPADTAGKNYWISQIESGAIKTQDDFTNALLGGVSNSDKAANAAGATAETAWTDSLSADSPTLRWNAAENKWEDVTKAVPTVTPAVSEAKRPADNTIRAITEAVPTVTPAVSEAKRPADNTIRAITKEETVSGQLNKLLAEDSPYIQLARSRALETANARGLLNTSLAAGAGETAAIGAAAPIAAQDASTYAASGLSAQNANQELTQTGYASDLGLRNSSILSAQDANQKIVQNAFQSGLDYTNSAALAKQQADAQYKLQTDLTAQQAANTAALAKQQADAQYKLQTDLTAQQAANTAALAKQQADAQYKLQTDLMAQQAANTAALQTNLKNMDIALDLTQLDASVQNSFTNAITPLMQQTQSAIAAIQTTADSVMNSAAKTVAIQELKDLLQSQVSSIATIYGYSLTW